jgi:hypothetical protein
MQHQGVEPPRFRISRGPSQRPAWRFDEAQLEPATGGLRVDVEVQPPQLEGGGLRGVHGSAPDRQIGNARLVGLVRVTRGVGQHRQGARGRAPGNGDVERGRPDSRGRCSRRVTPRRGERSGPGQRQILSRSHRVDGARRTSLAGVRDRGLLVDQIAGESGLGASGAGRTPTSSLARPTAGSAF